jgi:hypothetical protein
MARRQQASEYRDPEQAPSAKWGWHGAFPRDIRIAGVISIIIMLGLMFPTTRRWAAPTCCGWADSCC